jgi:TRAP-type C4-dicarboxylate transport system substrate-binding protein
VLEPWCQALAKDSGGRISCKIFPAMTIGGTPAQLVDTVKNGVADVIWTAPGYTTGRFPVMEAMELPFVIRDSVSGSRAAWAFYQRHAQAEFSAYKVLSVSMDGGMAVHASKPLKTDVLAGLKLRASGRMMAKTLSALGAIPVAMPPPQITESVAKGVIDGALSAWEQVVPFKLDEVTRYHVEPAAGQPFPASAVVMLLMNKARYDALPADLKAVVDRWSGAALVDLFGQVWSEETEAGRKRVAETGHVVQRWSERDVAAMLKATAPVEAEWVQQMDAKGLHGKELAAAAHQFGSGK